ncbi:MAG: phosphatase PAP2 family protein [Actinomycetota bacterium]|nr:phosphatase PAP2 family protein [Actinomycetota bacterium]
MTTTPRDTAPAQSPPSSAAKPPRRAAGTARWPAGTASWPALRDGVRGQLRRPRSPLWLELAFIAWLCWLYDDINNLSPLRVASAMANGRFLLHLEQTVHLDPEASLDHWLAAHSALGWVAGTYYDNAHFVTTLGLLALVWWKFPDRYRPLRNGLILTNLVAMAVFWLVPTAPPRLLDPARFIDVVGQSHSFGSWHTGALATAANQLAAMPSMHLGWAAWSALAAWRILPPGRWRHLVWVYPLVTAVVVIATGNHYLCDVVAGVVVFAGSQLVVERWSGWWAAREARRALSDPAPVAPHS